MLREKMESAIRDAVVRSMQAENGSVYSIYYDSDTSEFTTYEFANRGSWIDCDHLQHVITIENQNDETFWDGFEPTEYYTEDDFINDIIDKNGIVEMYMEKVEEEGDFEF